MLQRSIVEHRMGQQPLQARVLIHEPPQALGLTDIHPVILGLPLVDGRIADTMRAAQISDRNLASTPSE
jgi:hypothetical protein